MISSSNIKKGAILIEVLISITLFGIIVIFFQKSINLIQNTNKFFTKQIQQTNTKSYFKKVLFLDLIKSNQIKILTTKQNNIYLKIITTNYYHNPFYNHITYLLLPNNKLIRIESKKEFKIDNIDNDFLQNSYIDIVLTNIKKFKATETKLNNNKKVYFMIEDTMQNIFYFSI